MAAKTYNAADATSVRLLQIEDRIVVRIYFNSGSGVSFFDIKSDLNQAFSLAKDAYDIMEGAYRDRFR